MEWGEDRSEGCWVVQGGGMMGGGMLVGMGHPGLPPPHLVNRYTSVKTFTFRTSRMRSVMI